MINNSTGPIGTVFENERKTGFRLIRRSVTTEIKREETAYVSSSSNKRWESSVFVVESATRACLIFTIQSLTQKTFASLRL